jgi:hypothetical protein
MKPDLYTKSVLTAIAVLLFWQCFQRMNNPRAVSAQEAPQPVVIVGVSPFSWPRNIPVEIKNDRYNPALVTVVAK